MSISAKQVAELRQQSGAGMMDCKKALVETGGDMAKAVEYLQKKNLAAADKRADKVAADGAVASYVHHGRIGVLLEINCETDFVGRGDEFQDMVRNVAMHIAAANPSYVRQEEVSEEEIAKRREIYMAQMRESGKPENILERIIDGKIKKWLSEICLLDQSYVKNPDQTVLDYVNEIGSTVREKIHVRRFVRFELGEGIEKEESDFASEVAAAAQI
jgi:elongation factor Ts